MRTNEKSIELTVAELDKVVGGKTGPTHLPPRNPFPWPTDTRLSPTR